MKTTFDARRLASLAKIALSPEEETLFQSQLQDVLVYIKKILILDISKTEPLIYTSASSAFLRKDIVQPGLSPEEALSNAPDVIGNQFIVPRVIEE